MYLKHFRCICQISKYLGYLTLSVFVVSCSSEKTPPSSSSSSAVETLTNKENKPPSAATETTTTDTIGTSCKKIQIFDATTKKCVDKSTSEIVEELSLTHPREYEEICTSLEVTELKEGSIESALTFFSNPLEAIKKKVKKLVEPIDERCKKSLQKDSKDKALVRTIISDTSNFDCTALNMLVQDVAILHSTADQFNTKTCVEQVSTPAALILNTKDTSKVLETLEAAPDGIPLAILLKEGTGTLVTADGQLAPKLVTAVTTSSKAVSVGVSKPEQDDDATPFANKSNAQFIATGSKEDLAVITGKIMEEETDLSDEYKTHLEGIFTGRILAMDVANTNVSIPKGTQTLYRRLKGRILQKGDPGGTTLVAAIDAYDLCHTKFPASLTHLNIELGISPQPASTIFLNLFCENKQLPQTIKHIFVKGPAFSTVFININEFNCTDCQLTISGNASTFNVIQPTDNFKQLTSNCPNTTITVFEEARTTVNILQNIVDLDNNDNLNATKDSLYKELSKTVGLAKPTLDCPQKLTITNKLKQ